MRFNRLTSEAVNGLASAVAKIAVTAARNACSASLKAGGVNTGATGAGGSVTTIGGVLVGSGVTSGDWAKTGSANVKDNARIAKMAILRTVAGQIRILKLCIVRYSSR